jgi:hypothetical protein
MDRASIQEKNSSTGDGKFNFRSFLAFFYLDSFYLKRLFRPIFLPILQAVELLEIIC